MGPLTAEKTDGQLLAEYAQSHSDDAFRQLVSRHVDLVHAAAVRQVRDRHLADDITQAVFLVLAQRAASIDPKALLSGWLLVATRNVARNAMRHEWRLKDRERKAAEMHSEEMSQPLDLETQRVAPVLDEALTRLNEADRQALVARFFESKTHQQLADVLGISEQAAAKRVARALEKLQQLLERAGVTTTEGALLSILPTMVIKSASPELVASIQSSLGGPVSPGAAALVKAGNVAAWPVKWLVASGIGVTLLAATVGGWKVVEAFHREQSNLSTRGVNQADFDHAIDALPGPVVYQSDFAQSQKGWISAQVSTTPRTHEAFLANVGKKATFRLAQLPPHRFLRIQFDLYIINLWSGPRGIAANEQSYPADLWSMKLSDRPTLIRTVFSTTPDDPGYALDNKLQNYPAMIPSLPVHFGTGAAGINTLGFTRTVGGGRITFDMDATYRIDVTLPHNDPTVEMIFEFVRDMPKERWGVNNLRIEALPASAGSELRDADLQDAWNALSANDPVAGNAAFWKLVSAGDVTTRFLQALAIPAGFNRADVDKRLALIKSAGEGGVADVIEDLIAMGPGIESLLTSAELDRTQVEEWLDRMEQRPITEPAQRQSAAKARLLQVINTSLSRQTFSKWIDSSPDWQPDWRRRFYKVYRIDSHRAVAYVAAPFIPERKQFLQVRQVMLSNSGIKAEDDHFPHVPEDASVPLIFVIPDDTMLVTSRTAVSQPESGLGRVLSRLRAAGTAKNGWMPVQFPEAIRSHAFNGDWLIRFGSSQEQLLGDLAEIISRETGNAAEFVKKDIPKDKLVVSGKFEFKPLPAENPAIEVFVDSREEVANAKTIHLELGMLLRDVAGVHGLELQIPNDVAKKSVAVRVNGLANASTGNRAADKAAARERLDKVLNHLTSQTGLIFKHENAMETTYVLSTGGGL